LRPNYVLSQLIQTDYGLSGADANLLNSLTSKIQKIGTLIIAPNSLGRADTNLNPLTLEIQTTHSLAETCASQNVIPTSLNCIVLRVTCAAAPIVNISGMISVIIGAPQQSTIIVQGGKKVVMMPSPNMLTCFALVLACFTHANPLCNEEEGALTFEKVVRSFPSCMLLVTLAVS
jgi:hypothetical protein